MRREPVRSGRDTRSLRSHGDRTAREDVPAHDDMDVRMMMMSVGEEPWWEEEGTRPDGDAFDSLGLWDEEAVADLDHHTSEARTDAPEESWGGTRAGVGGNWDLDPASASPVAVHARRKWPAVDLAADTEADRRRAVASAQRSSSEDRRYERAQRPRRGRRRE